MFIPQDLSSWYLSLSLKKGFVDINLLYTRSQSIMGFFWGIMALLAMVIFIFLPILTDRDNYKLWIRRFRQGRWVPSPATNILPTTTTTSSTPTTPAVSAETLQQEDVIRNRYLEEKLQSYSTAVSQIGIAFDVTWHSYSLTHLSIVFLVSSGPFGTTTQRTRHDDRRRHCPK